jgi:hypothetical protein
MRQAKPAMLTEVDMRASMSKSWSGHRAAIADGPAMKQRSDTGQGSQAAELHPGRHGLVTRE